MAKKFARSIDMLLNEIQNHKIQNLATDPTADAAHQGCIYYNTADKTIRFCTGTAWVKIGYLQQLTATGDVSIAGYKITNLGTPINNADAATKAYVDSLINGQAWKQAVRAASTGNVVIATNALAAVDGVTPVAGDRILLKNQTVGGENGIYIAGAGAWTRSTDMDIAVDFPSATVMVQEGTANQDTTWSCTTNAPITLGTTATVWVQTSGLGQITAGNGLTKTGNQIDVVAGSGIVVAADSVSVDWSLAEKKYVTAIGDGTATTFTITHNLNNQNAVLSAFIIATNEDIEPDLVRSSANAFSITFTGYVAAASAIRVVVEG